MCLVRLVMLYVTLGYRARELCKALWHHLTQQLDPCSILCMDIMARVTRNRGGCNRARCRALLLSVGLVSNNFAVLCCACLMFGCVGNVFDSLGFIINIPANVIYEGRQAVTLLVSSLSEICSFFRCPKSSICPASG